MPWVIGAVERAGLAAAVALGSALGIAFLLAASPGARAGGEAVLPPDLVTLAIGEEDLAVMIEERRTLLRLSNEIGNVGAGPLEVFPSSASTGCDADSNAENDRAASQRLFEDTNASGAFERESDAVTSERLFGCLRYHPAHDHWHTLDFARYELRREPSGRLMRSRRKVGFCIADFRQAHPSPASPAEASYPFGSLAERGCDERATQGLSAGWADLYALDLPGQEFDVGDLRRGRYCLISRADPLDLLVEANEHNNVRRVRIELRPGQLEVRRLETACRIGASG